MADALSPPNAGGAPPLPWGPDIPVRYVTVDGMRIRYLVAGSGPALVLLHTLRTQLDMFQKVIPELATRFRVYALDYPGHGHSDTPGADYAAEFFVSSVAGVLDQLNIQDAMLAGESIGGTIALLRDGHYALPAPLVELSARHLIAGGSNLMSDHRRARSPRFGDQYPRPRPARAGTVPTVRVHASVARCQRAVGRLAGRIPGPRRRHLKPARKPD